MLISPQTAIDNGWIKFPEWMPDEFRAKCIQPNALDFTIDHIHEIDEGSMFLISETEKRMRKTSPLMPAPSGVWELLPKKSYDFTSDFYVNVPADVAVMFIIRSTFNRNGLFLTTGLFDSGFQGACAGVLHNQIGLSLIAPRTRIGQVMFVSSDSVGMYAGGYNHAEGTHWTEKK